MVPQTNIDVLRHILRYCEKIDILIERFGFDVEIFKKDENQSECEKQDIVDNDI